MLHIVLSVYANQDRIEFNVRAVYTIAASNSLLLPLPTITTHNPTGNKYIYICINMLHVILSYCICGSIYKYSVTASEICRLVLTREEQ